MKTAIDQVLEIIQLARECEIDNDLRSIRHRVEQLKPVFKQQIIDAFQEGYYECENNSQDRQLRKEDYFTQKYEQ